MQNSIDCGSTRIDVRITQLDDPPRTVVEVRNDGEPMDAETLTGKLLSLGSSGKDFKGGSVGGFGKAKEILYFAHEGYEIHTGPHRVRGSGAGYNFEPRPHLDGTLSVVTWKGHVAGTLKHAFVRFVVLCGWQVKAEFTVDGESVRPMLGRGSFRRAMEVDGVEWARVWTTRSTNNVVVVRVNGVPMFTERCDYKSGVIIELTGKSSERLTSNRDGLIWPYRGRLGDFVTQLTVDKRTALKNEEPEYRRFEGARLKRAVESKEDSSLVQMVVRTAALVLGNRGRADDAGIGVVDPVHQEPRRASVLPYDFITKNCLGRKIPGKFDPDSLQFSDHAHWLVRVWVGSLLELHDLFGINDTFSVGFLFSEEAEAEFEHGEYGKVYLLNPCTIHKGRASHRYKKSHPWNLVAVAAHEFVHGGLNCSYHDEDYASRLTEAMAFTLQHRRRFARHLG